MVETNQLDAGQLMSGSSLTRSTCNLIETFNGSPENRIFMSPKWTNMNRELLQFLEQQRRELRNLSENMKMIKSQQNFSDQTNLEENEVEPRNTFLYDDIPDQQEIVKL